MDRTYRIYESCRSSISSSQVHARRPMTDTGHAGEGTLKADVIKVAIIEDRREIREGLAILINGTDGYRCTGGFRTMEEALDKIGYELPEVALVDIGLPGMSGIDGIRILKERYPSLLL